MGIEVFFDKDKSTDTVNEIPGFPWVRHDADGFIWEEALYNGSYRTVNCSAMGRCMSREQVFGKLNSNRWFGNHLLAFQLEINGQLLKRDWRWENEIREECDDGSVKTVVKLAHNMLPVSVDIHTYLDGTSFITRWLEVKNTGDKPLAVSRIFPLSGIFMEYKDSAIITDEYRPKYSLGTFKQNFIFAEGEFAWQALQKGTFRIDTWRSFYNPPLFIVKNEVSGEMIVIHFETTVNMQVEFSYHGDPMYVRFRMPAVDDYLHIRVGFADHASYRILEPGQTVVTPKVHFSSLYGDLDTCTNQLFRHLRKSVSARHAGPVSNPVEYNHTGYTQNATVTKGLLFKEVDVAASIGAELFVVDAGWFGPADSHWGNSMGDWSENPLLENGLCEVFDYARSKGMMCGLWVAIENVNSELEFIKKHPDWLLVIDGGKAGLLDITKPEVEEYMYETIVSLIEKFRLDCFRIDGGCSNAAERISHNYIESTMWEYFDALYRIFEKVKKRFPNLYLENCSAGGGRIDMGLMSRFNWTQISDNWNPAQQVRILNGVTMAIPPEQCMYLAGAINQNTADPDFLVRAGIFGQFCASGVFPQVEKSNVFALNRWRHAIDIYKREVRPILSTCKVYHHTPIQNYSNKGEWVILEYVAEDESRAVVGVFRLPDAEDSEYRFKARGFDISKNYSVYFDNLERTIVVSGRILCLEGIDIKVDGKMKSELLLIKETE